MFVRLGERLDRFGSDERSQRAMERAVEQNSWFSPTEIRNAVGAIRSEMLVRSRLGEWLGGYPELPVDEPADILVVTAGNIPLVGFADMVYTLCSGHRCIVKPSGKDSALTEYIIGMLQDEGAAIVADDGSRQPDALIATGGDNAVRYFRAAYRSLPMLLRGSRSSAAVICGDEPESRLDALANDIYMYSGLGCRNVSLLFVPSAYDLSRISARLAAHPVRHSGYMNNYRQQRAVRIMSGQPFIDLGHSILTEQCDFPAAISRINFCRYDHAGQVAKWLASHEEQIQCIAADRSPFDGTSYADTPVARRVTPLGTTQHPSLTDYPDGKDVMEFLAGIRPA